jgi:hypothetical protein
MTLAETQALFRTLLTEPAQVAPGAAARCFVGTPALPAAERLGIYQGMYRARLADALRETFPNLARCLGDGAFAALASDYLERHPSDHHDLGRFGRHLAAFLRRHPAPDRGDLADLTELEWARHRSFTAAPHEPVGPGAFAGLDAESASRTGLRLSPALSVLRLDHAVASLWRRLEDGLPPGPPTPGPAAVAVWRSGFEVFHATLPLDEAAALLEAGAGATLADTCAAFGGRDAPAAAAHAALSSWLGEGWISGIEERSPAGTPPL